MLLINVEPSLSPTIAYPCAVQKCRDGPIDMLHSASRVSPGVISSYILQILVVHLRDIEGRLQKLLSIVANLVNVYGPVQQAAKTDWAVFRLMHWASLLQRAHPQDVWESAQENELIAEKDAALTLVSDVSQAVQSEVSKSASSQPSQPLIFVTAAWGWMSEQLRGVLRRWRVVSKTSPLLVLCRDRLAADACETMSDLRYGPVRCVVAPRRLGVEAIVAKYLVPRLGSGDPWWRSMADAFLIKANGEIMLKYVEI